MDPRPGMPANSYSTPDAGRERDLRMLVHILYALYIVHWLTGGVSILVAIIIAYVKRDDAAGTPYEPHFQWLIRTFWMGLGGYVVSGALVVSLIFFPIGILMFSVVSIWMLYRIVKGWLYLYDNKPLAARAWF